MVFRHAPIPRKGSGKQQQLQQLDKLMNDVVKIDNALRQKAKIRGLFSTLFDEMSADHKNLLLHSEVRRL